jgi:hypothetical protein
MIESDLMRGLKEQIEEELPWLLKDYEFRITRATHDAECFGDSVVCLMSRFFALRLRRNRGQTFVDIASPAEPNVWWKVVFFNRYIFGEDKSFDDFKSLGNYVRENFPLLTDSFGRDYRKTKMELQRQEREWGQSLSGLFSKNRSTNV